MKQLIKTIEQDEYSNKYYYNKMLSDFELESRYNALVRSKKNKFRSESLKYLERVHHMKEKTEENFINRKKSLDEKNLKIKKRKMENQKLKEEIKRQSHELFSEKEKKAKDTYNRKLKMDEIERVNNEKKLIDKSKKNISINKFLFFYSENNNKKK